MKNKITTTIGFWSFIFVIAIGFGYLNNYVWASTGQKLIFTGGSVISYFLFLAGFYLMKNFKENQSKEMAFKKSWKYTLNRFSKLYPTLFGGVLCAFIIRNVINKTSILNIFGVFINSIWEFLGLSQIGIVNALEVKTLTFNPVAGVSYIWNAPLWVVSAIIISTLILYYVVSKSEDFFAGIFAPVFLILTYTSIGFAGKLDSNLLNSFGILNGLARVIAAMIIGMYLYYIVEYFKKKKFSENIKLLLSFLHVILGVFILWNIYNGINWSEVTNSLFILLFLAILLIDKDYISVLYNKSPLCLFLGKLSYYYYAYFIVFVFMLAYIFPEMSYGASLIFNLLYSICWAYIMFALDDSVITPIFRKKRLNKN